MNDGAERKSCGRSSIFSGSNLNRLAAAVVICAVQWAAGTSGLEAAEMTAEEVAALLAASSREDPPDLSSRDLSGLDLSGLDFKSGNLRGADLSGAKLPRANLQGVELQRAKLAGADLT